MQTQLVPLSLLDTRAEWHKPAMKVDDETLRRSIEEGGIQQPLIVLPDGKRFLVVDGIRRMKLARAAFRRCTCDARLVVWHSVSALAIPAATRA